MNYLCMFLGVIFCCSGVLFALGKLHNYLTAWRVMEEQERKAVKIKPLCRNVGFMIIVYGMIFTICGYLHLEQTEIFRWAVVLWSIASLGDVYFISKSSWYKIKAD